MAKEVRLDIYNGNTATMYYADKIVEMSADKMMFDGAPSVGNCICGELDVELLVDSDTIPKNAKMIPYIREEGSPQWKKRSVYYIYNREQNELTGALRIVAYDCIYRAEESFTQPGDQGTWPRLDKTIMQEIASRTNTSIDVDSLTAMNRAYMIQYPGIILEDGTLKPDGDGALTMREVAGQIASMYGGNWIIDNAGNWRLVKLGSIPQETHYLIRENGNAILIGGVRILV